MKCRINKKKENKIVKSQGKIECNKKENIAKIVIRIKNAREIFKEKNSKDNRTLSPRAFNKNQKKKRFFDKRRRKDLNFYCSQFWVIRDEVVTIIENSFALQNGRVSQW